MPRKSTKAAAAETEKTVTPLKTAAAKAEKADAEKKTEKKQTVKKTVARKPAVRKTASKTKEVNKEVYVQFAGSEYSLKDIEENAKKAWIAETGSKESDIKEIQIYIKPEERAAYYVVNGEVVEGGRKIDL